MTVDKHSTEHYFTSEPRSEERFGLVRTTLRDRNFEFLTSASVFSKRRIDVGTRLLIESMVLPQSGGILDIGCGYGAVGVVAASLKPNLKVIMTDVNMRAVRLARRNVELNNISNAEVRFGYFYEPVEGLLFDCVLSNPPVSAGMETVKTIIRRSPSVLADRGTFQMVIRSKIGSKALPAIFEETFGNVKVLARGSGFRVLLGQQIA